MAGGPAPGLVRIVDGEEIAMKLYPVLLVLFTLTACDDRHQQPPAGGSAWKTQMEVLEKAQNVEGMVSEGSARQRSLIDQQTQ